MEAICENFIQEKYDFLLFAFRNINSISKHTRKTIKPSRKYEKNVYLNTICIKSTKNNVRQHQKHIKTTPKNVIKNIPVREKKKL